MATFGGIIRRRFISTQYPSLTVNNEKHLPKLIGKKMSQEPDLRKVVKMFMNASDVEAFRRTAGLYNVTVKRFALANQFELIEDILEYQKKYIHHSVPMFPIRLIKLYGESGLYEQARNMFDEMPKLNCLRTVNSFNALLGACVDSKKFYLVDSFFWVIPLKVGIVPNEYSYSILIKELCEMGSFDSAMSVIDDMKKNGLAPNVINYNTLLSFLYKHGRLSDSHKIWTQMKLDNVLPDVKTYTTKLSALAEERKMSEAVKLVDEMRSRGIKADLISFCSMISRFSDKENPDEAMSWFDRIKACCVVPDDKTYDKIIWVSCENCNFEMALALCQNLFQQMGNGGRQILQGLVYKLFFESKVYQAKKLVELVGSINSCHYNLQMPSEY